jgi:hypothetical protein
MQTTNAIEPPPAPWYRHRWPWLIMLGPFLVVLAGSYTMWLAYTRQDALVVGDYYTQGKAINRDLTRDRAATTLGVSVSLRYDAAAGRLQGKVSAASGALQGPMTLKLVHSTRPEKDIVLPLVANADGNFSVSLPLLEMARWQVMLEDGGRNWRVNGVWPWPQQAAVALSASQP